MRGIARQGLDTAGGAISSGSPDTFVDGYPVARHGDSVTPHGEGSHNGATLIASQNEFFVNGLAVVGAGDSATCGHTVGPGSPSAQVGT